MANYEYIGTEARTFPEISTLVEPGDVCDWGDIEPDGRTWQPHGGEITKESDRADLPVGARESAPEATEPIDAQDGAEHTPAPSESLPVASGAAETPPFTEGEQHDNTDDPKE